MLSRLARSLILSSALAACGGSSPSPTDGSPQGDAGTNADAQAGDAANRQSVVIQFAARVGSAAFSCSQSYSGLGADNSETRPGDLRFYVQDVALVDEQGRATPVTLDADGRWQQANVALLDFENKQGECANGTEPTNDRVVGTVPVGRYRGLRFTIGVPFDLNHKQLTDSRPPLDLTALFWSWNSGHLFFKAEASAAGPSAGDAGAADAGDAGTADANPDTAGADASAGARRNVFAFHAGSVQCTGNASEGALTACLRPNRGGVDLSTFVPGTNKVIVDFAEIFAESRLQSLAGCHSFSGGDACTAPFRRIGVDPMTGQPSPTTQKVFRTE
jgi:uncharacterized repeat protein (TIGR04052 family)